jgi:sulfite reductase (NADPH) flavoprotein alpha-component
LEKQRLQRAISLNHDKNNPGHCFIKDRYLLTKPASSHHVYHIVLDNSPSNLSFKTGDALGIYGQNDPVLVERIVNALQLSPYKEFACPRSQKTINITTFLSEKANISRINPATLSFFQNSSSSHTDLIDFLEETKPIINNLSILMATLSPLLPRFYSIASSRMVHPREIHLTVTPSSYRYKEEERQGVASYFLITLAKLNKTKIPCYIQPTAHFTLPADPSTPIIMIGPGTGIAPLRAFLEQRLFDKATGKNWLFFGARERAHDFLYEDFLINLTNKNQLILDLAFSRDQTKKIYVQDKLYEKGALVWQWIEDGASIYICGNADPMAKNVKTTLKQIFQKFGSLSETASIEFFKKLCKEKRCLMDIY